MPDLVLSNGLCQARVVPEQGGRVASLIDLKSDRELLFQRTPEPGPRVDYLASSAGGWEEMFPNDSPYDGYPFHGVLWHAPFEVERLSPHVVWLTLECRHPAVSVGYRLELLPAPRRGVSVSIALTAHADTGPFLWASHPMLAVEPGWTIGAEGPIDVDSEMPGRFASGPLPERLRGAALTVPRTAEPLGEVLYLPGNGTASVTDPTGTQGTRVRVGLAGAALALGGHDCQRHRHRSRAAPGTVHQPAVPAGGGSRRLPSRRAEGWAAAQLERSDRVDRCRWLERRTADEQRHQRL